MFRERIASKCICCDSKNLYKSPAVLMPFVAKRVFDHEPVMITPEWGMRDLKLGMAYSVCNTIQCTDCGILFLDMRFSAKEMALLYDNYRSEEYTSLREYYEPGYRKTNDFYSNRGTYISKIEEFLRPYLPSSPAILDWGGDTGINTPLLEQAGIVHIYDISNKPTVGIAQSVDLPTVKRSKYDLIVCSMVLEHVSYPLDFINEIVSIMDRDTLFYLEVPFEVAMQNITESKEFHPVKRHWHEHINFFSEKSLHILVERAGLELLKLKSINASEGWRDDRNACVFSFLCRLR